MKFLISVVFIILQLASCDDTTSVQPCGNGIMEEGEACDGNDFGDDSCYSRGMKGGVLSCTSECTIDSSFCTEKALCGNGLLEREEECEGEDLRGQTCESLGFAGGVLACRDNCAFDLTGCDYGEWSDHFISSMMSADSRTVCATDEEGSSWCWGRNSFNNVGTEQMVYEYTPLPVFQQLPFTQMSIGFLRACGRTNAGAVYCWGLNKLDSLGVFDRSFSDDYIPFPIEIEVGEPVQHIEAGFSSYLGGNETPYSCALLESGVVKCWGANIYGRAGGDDSITSSATPIEIEHQVPFIALSAGGHHTCALDENHETWCWGLNAWGLLGQMPEDEIYTDQATRVSGNHSFTQIAAGGGGDLDTLGFTGSWLGHTCGIDNVGNAWCWGQNFYGELGVDPTETGWSATPIAVGGDHVFKYIDAGMGYTCGIDDNDRVLCWGSNQSKKLGIGETYIDFYTHTPTLVSFDGTATKISIGQEGACLVSVEDELWCWGMYPGNGTVAEATPVKAMEQVKDVFAGFHKSCAITLDEEVLCWGFNMFSTAGQLRKEKVFYKSPVVTEDGALITDFGLTHNATLAVDSEGQSWYWGIFRLNGIESDTATPLRIYTDQVMRSMRFADADTLNGIDANGQVVVMPYAVEGTVMRPFDVNDPPFIQIQGNAAINIYGELASFSSDLLSPAGTYVDTPHTYKYLGNMAYIDILGRMWGTCIFDEPPWVSEFMLDDSDYSRATCGEELCCGINEKHKLKCWNIHECEVYEFPTDHDVKEISIGKDFACLITTENGIACWGTNSEGQLGDGTLHSSDTPVIPKTYDQWKNEFGLN